jgi:CheY-like chemotaxis protein
VANSSGAIDSTIQYCENEAVLEAEACSAVLSDASRFEKTGIILLVEDEQFVREAATQILQSAGYEVLVASNGPEGITACIDSRIDLLLADIVMPGMSGHELARAFKVLNPGGRVLLMSGYCDELSECMVHFQSKINLIKPFSASTLLQAVHAALFHENCNSIILGS